MFEDTFQGRERRVGGVVLLGAMASRSRADQDGQTATDVERSSPTVVPGVRPLTIETLAAPLTDHTRDPGRAWDGRRESVATAIDIGGSLEAIARQFQRMRDPKSSDFSDQELQIELQSRDGRDLSHGNIRKNQQLGTGLFSVPARNRGLDRWSRPGFRPPRSRGWRSRSANPHAQENPPKGGTPHSQNRVRQSSPWVRGFSGFSILARSRNLETNQGGRGAWVRKGVAW